MRNASEKSSKAGLAAPCGIYCGACFRYVVDDTCRGCRLETERKLVQTCSIRECCGERGVNFCSDCLDFPCARLRRFSSRGKGDPDWHHRHVMIENLREIKRQGLKAWLREIENRTKSGEYRVGPRKRFERLRSARFRRGKKTSPTRSRSRH
jgi:hypothetical protein